MHPLGELVQTISVDSVAYVHKVAHEVGYNVGQVCVNARIVNPG